MKVNILISCHKQFKTLNNDTFLPIQVGTEVNGNKIENILHDNDMPDNISAKNKKYCELTSHYYAYKNIDADYYGFFHYRRYLSFSPTRYKANSENHVVENTLTENTVKKFGLDEENVKKVVSQYDVLVPEKRISFDIVGTYGAAKTQTRQEIDFCFDYVAKNYPEMCKAIKKYKHAFYGYFYNMFIMKKDIFKHYANWMFDILSAHEKTFEVEHYDVQSYRVSGYLAERLTGLYITWLKLKGDVKIKELQTIMFKNVDIDNFPQDACNVVLPASNKTFLQTNVLVNSIVSNCSANNNYKIFITEKHLHPHYKNLLSKYAKSNIRIIFKNAKTFDANTIGKYVYLNNNTIVNEDIANLYNTDCVTKHNGCYDIAKIIKFGKTRLGKQLKKLQKYNPYQQINSDVMVVDNSKPEGNTILDLSWNAQVNHKKDLNGKAYSFVSHKVYNEYVKSTKKPKVVTYYGCLNPTNNPTCELGDIFWKYAKTSNVYELLIYNLIMKFKKVRQSAYDKLFPNGSTLRLAIKTYITKY